MAKSEDRDRARGKRVAALRKSVGGSQSDFGDRFGVEQATVSRWESGWPIKRAYWKGLAALAGMPMLDFIFGETQRIPLFTKVAASSMNFADDSIDEESVDKWIGYSDLDAGDWIALPVFGGSMDKIAPDGAIILVNRNERELKEEAYYVFRLGGETTFKMYLDGPPRLEPYTNEKGHRAIFVDDDGYEVVGRVRRVIISV